MKEGYHSYHLDVQNSTGYITGRQEEVENSYQYDAFGVVRNSHERMRNRVLYTGQQYDQITGQYYLRARYYNPQLGRFLQEDPYRGDGLNLYTYCNNNPVTYYDPSGYDGDRVDYYFRGTTKEYGGGAAANTGSAVTFTSTDPYVATHYAIQHQTMFGGTGVVQIAKDVNLQEIEVAINPYGLRGDNERYVFMSPS